MNRYKNAQTRVSTRKKKQSGAVWYFPSYMQLIINNITKWLTLFVIYRFPFSIITMYYSATLPTIINIKYADDKVLSNLSIIERVLKPRT